MKRVMVFKRFERFWHWSQAALIFFLLTTGLRSTAAIACSVSVVPCRCTPPQPGC